MPQLARYWILDTWCWKNKNNFLLISSIPARLAWAARDGGQAETGIQHLLHKCITLCYQCALPQNSNKSQFMNNILERSGKGATVLFMAPVFQLLPERSQPFTRPFSRPLVLPGQPFVTWTFWACFFSLWLSCLPVFAQHIRSHNLPFCRPCSSPPFCG